MQQAGKPQQIDDVAAYMRELGRRARSASRTLAAADTGAKNGALQAIADDRKTYTRERLAAFLRQPHFPMRKFVLSESDIRNIIGFIEGLGGPPQTQ